MIYQIKIMKKKKEYYDSKSLRTAKTELGYSLDDIKAKTKLAINTIRAGLAGRNIGIVNLYKLSKCLGVDWSRLFVFEGKK